VIKAKFHYAIHVADQRVRVAGRSQAGRKLAANRSATRFELSRHVKIARTCPRQVCDLDSVMEFGLYRVKIRSNGTFTVNRAV